MGTLNGSPVNDSIIVFASMLVSNVCNDNTNNSVKCGNHLIKVEYMIEIIVKRRY